MRRLREWHARHGSITLGKGGVLILVGLAVAAGLYVLIVRSPANDDQSAIRAWFASPSGGGAPSAVVRKLDVSGCSYTRYQRGGTPVFACAVSFEGASFTGCFTIDDAEHVGGGWPVSLAGCSSVRWDAAHSAFVDEATGEPPFQGGG